MCDGRADISAPGGQPVVLTSGPPLPPGSMREHTEDKTIRDGYLLSSKARPFLTL